MITEAILKLVYGVVAVILEPIQLMFAPLGDMSGLVELFAYASIFIPVGALTTCLGGWLIMQSARLTMSIVNWIIAKIPTID